MMEPLLLTIPQAAARLGCGRTMVYRLITDRELPEVHLGTAARIPLRALEEFVERKAAQAQMQVPLQVSESQAHLGRRRATR